MNHFTLVKMMAFQLFGIKPMPVPELVLTYFELGFQDKNVREIWIKTVILIHEHLFQKVVRKILRQVLVYDLQPVELWAKLRRQSRR